MNRLPLDVKQPIFERMGYTPNPRQLEFHDAVDPFIALISGGVRSGKSVGVAAEAVPHCLLPSPAPYLVPLIGPTYEEPRAEFDYITGWLQDMGVLDVRDISRPKEGPAEFTIRPRKTASGLVYGARVRTYTASEVERIRSFNAEFIVMCEAGGIEKEAFYNIVERLTSTGGFLIGSGTLELSQSWYFDTINEGQIETNWERIRSFIVPTWDNLASFPDGRDDIKIKRTEAIIPAERFAVRFGGEPVKMQGLVVQCATTDVISEEAEYISGQPVELAIDPGYSGAYAVLAIQQREGGICVIDEVYSQFHTTDEVVAECRDREWWDDILAENPGVIDRAAKQHHASDSVLEKWAELTSFWLDLNEAVIPVEDGADQLRMYIMSGHLKVSPKCRGLLSEWGIGASPLPNQAPWHYRRDKTGNLHGDRAVTGADHSSTALIYWLVNRYGFVSPEYLATMFGWNFMFAVRGELNEPYGARTPTRVNPVREVSV